jgi:hypothetical protein
MNNKIEIPREVFENIFFANGGTKKEVAKELAGNYQAPLTKDRLHTANAEVEKNEYVFDSNGIRKFGGNTHEKGGTPVKLEEGARILSDHLKIGADLAKELTKSLKLPFRATDTYAKALDRFNNASDLPKLNKEIEDLILKMDSKKSKDKTTFALNNEFLNNTLNTKNKQKQPLEKEMAGFFDMLFQEQESSKKAESGYKMQLGGSYMELAAKHGIDPERAKEILKNLPHYQDAEAKFPEEEPKVKPQPSRLPWNEQNNPYFAINPGREGKLKDWMGDQMYKAEYELGDLKASSERFKDLAQNAGFEYTEADFKDMPSLNRFAGRLQEHITKTKPELAYDYGLNVEPTRQGLQYLVDNKIIKPEEYGIKMINGKVARGSYDTLSAEAENKLSGVISKLPDNTKKDYALTNYKDNLGYFRGIKTKDQELSDEEYKRFTSEHEPVGDGYYKTDIPGAYVKPILIGEQKPGETPETTSTGDLRFAQKPFKFKPAEDTKIATTEEAKRRRGLLLLPDQTPILPNLLPSLKVQRRFSRIGYNDISPEQQLSEMNRSSAAGRQSLEGLSPQQRAAAEIGLVANENMMSNKAIADVNRTNAAARNAVDVYNAKVSDAEENASAGDALSYEQRTHTALGNYDKEIQGYYDKLASNQMNNWKTVEALNRYNALNPDVQFTGEGYEVNRTPGFSESARQYLDNLYKEDKSARKKTKTATAKFGGRFKK